MKTILSVLLLAALGTTLNAQVDAPPEGRGLNRFFAMLDTDGNGFLTEGEILNALLTQQMLPQAELIVFANEMSEVADRPNRFSKVNPEKFTERLYARADRNQDAVISKEEFLNQTIRRQPRTREG